MKNKLWFTLIETIISISISLILMIWVSLFIVNWMEKITIQKNILVNLGISDNYFSNINDRFLSKKLTFKDLWTNSWILLKSSNIFWKWTFSYIWVKTMTWYCTEKPDLTTKHLQIIDFIPFEWKNFDIFSNNTFSWWEVLWDLNKKYITDFYNHNVYVWDKDDFSNTKELIIWNWTFGWKLDISWTWTYLNYPTWVAYGDSKLFISDTGNNRILYLSGLELYSLLNINDWIFEPTWLFYDNWILYISNSWKWEILAYYSNNIDKTSASLDFTPDENVLWVTWFNIKIKNQNWSDISLSWPNWTWSFSFSWFSSFVWDSVSLSNWINYLFSWSIDFLSWNNYSIDLSNISWTFTNWNYYTELELLWTQPKKYYYPFFTKWSWDITFSKSHNTLKLLTWGLSYPTWIYEDSWNLVVNDFLSRKKITINKNWDFVSESNLSDFDFISLNNIKDNLSKFIVDDFDYKLENWLLTLKIVYYKNYDCYNEGNNIKRTFIIKKLLND